MAHSLTLQEITPVTHDTFRLVFDRPEGFDFTAGQATEMALHREGWRDEGRPFTFTSQPEDPHLEFVIKCYTDHDGVTNQIRTMAPGETVSIGDPWGAIHDAGPGVFIAGGAGITPFIPVLRRRARDGALAGCHLIFANKSPEDIILREEWEAMAGLRTSFPVDGGAPDLPKGPVDGAFLDRTVSDFTGTFYFCGPPPMEEPVLKALHDRGVGEDQIIQEE